jgi:hypothetical protein
MRFIVDTSILCLTQFFLRAESPKVMPGGARAVLFGRWNRRRAGKAMKSIQELPEVDLIHPPHERLHCSTVL